MICCEIYGNLLEQLDKKIADKNKERYLYLLRIHHKYVCPFFED